MMKTTPVAAVPPLTVADLDVFKVTKPGPTYPPNVRRFYSPVDDVHGALKTVLGAVTRSLHLSMFGYDDDELAALVDRALTTTNVYCQVTLDSSQAGGVHEKAILARYHNDMVGNSVAIGRSEKGAIIHRKMMIVDGLWLVSGSTNWSVGKSGGETAQDNELTVAYDPEGCAEAIPILGLAHDAALKQMGRPPAQAAG